MATRTGTRTVALAAALVVVVVGCLRQPQATPTPTPAPTSQAVAAPAAGPMRCPVTIANGNGPPGSGSSPNYHGYGALWTALPPGGIDEGGTPEPGGWTSQKYPWWTVGTTGELTIQGRRVDARRRHCAPGSAAGCPKPPSLRFPAAAFGPAGSTRVPQSVGIRPFARA
jgi:hypothetical protein